MAHLAVEADRSIYYERHNPGAGRPVVLIHGWGMSARIWDTVLPALLANGNEVLSFDHRCCGMSDKDFDDVSIDALGSDVVRLVDHFDLTDVVLNGWSLGGAVAVDAAAKLGRTLAGLVSTGGATPKYTQGDGWTLGGTEEQLEATLQALSETRPSFLRGLSAAVCHAPVDQATVDWMWQIFMQTSPRADESLRDLGRIDQRKMLANLDVPAAIMRGEHDAIVPPGIGTEAAAMLSNGRLISFAESGHAPFLEEGDKYRRSLVEFVNGLS